MRGLGCCVHHRVAGKRQADDHGNGAGDGGGKNLLHHLHPAQAHQQTCGDGDQAGGDDAKLRDADGFRRQDTVHLDKALRRDQAADGGQVGKAGAVVHGDLTAGD
ncbi:hypothetical protein SDC9_131898 [bioreactor metagenome]|uniref:Uncharacterized protein n=1 Tax=bioreactor metagenome TaxID=1076179 RepID=A0A645D892_9ZZZZ